jgi:hypothetical protein
MRKAWPLLAVVSLLPALAAAQGTKISATYVCSPANPNHVLPVEGQPEHAYGVSQVKCTATKPWQIAAVASKEGIGTGVADVRGNQSQNHGTYVDTMANGDKVYFKYEFAATMKEAKPEKITGHKWEILGGTGKMKAIKGKGTCNATPQADGSVVYDCQGEYQ